MDFTIENGVLKSCRPETDETAAIIPDGVTSIGEYAFSHCRGLTSVVIPDSVTNIKEYAFAGCYKLSSVTISKNITSIGKGTFRNCRGLTSASIPDGVTSIEASVFEDCSGLASVSIPDSVTSIKEHAFSRCSGLTSITIPGSVKSIGAAAFQSCRSLTSITIPNSVKSIGYLAFSDCCNVTTLTIQDGTASTRIEEQAFDRCEGLTSLTIPGNVTSIGKNAFYACSGLTSVLISRGVKSIEKNAFDGCTSLISITIPESVTSIGPSICYRCFKLKELFNYSTLPTETQDIHPNIISPNIPIGRYRVKADATRGYLSHPELYSNKVAAENNDFVKKQWSRFLPDILENDSVSALKMIVEMGKINTKNYEEQFLTPAQNANAIQCVAFILDWVNTHISATQKAQEFKRQLNKDPYNVEDMKKIWKYKREDDGIHITGYKGNESEISVPDRIGKTPITGIDETAFSQCDGLTSITIPDSVKSIGAKAFFGCSGLTSITIPRCVTRIGKEAFSGCSGLEKFIVLPDNTAYYSAGNCLIEKSTQKLIAGCKSSIIPADGSVTSIEKGAFSYCRGLTSITIPDCIKEIGWYAFYNCAGLTSVVISDGVKRIGADAFDKCYFLNSVMIPESVTVIEERAFQKEGRVVVHTPTGSFAETYCLSNGIRVDNNFFIK